MVGIGTRFGLGRRMSSSVSTIVLVVILCVAVLAAWLWGKLQARLAHGVRAEQLGRLEHEVETERQRGAQLAAHLAMAVQQATSNDHRQQQILAALEAEHARVVADSTDCVRARALAEQSFGSLRERLEETTRERDQMRIAAERHGDHAAQAAQVAGGMRERCDGLEQRLAAEQARAEKWESA